MNKFAKLAQSSITLSDIMNGRVKVDKVDGEYHITDFDLVAGDSGPYAVCAVSDTEYINGGAILTKIFVDIVKEYSGDIDAARDAFSADGGITVKLARGTTKQGRSIVRVLSVY